MLSYDLEDIEEKIDKLCMENDLEYSFNNMSFPIVASIRPSFESKNQLTIDIRDKTTNFVNGEIKFIFADELMIKIENDFYIEDSLLNKFKSQFKKLHYTYLQIYFKERQEI